MSSQSPFPEPECSHYWKNDKGGFSGRMRFHQSWYRHYKLGAAPGPNPHAGGKPYGNMLEPEAGRKGLNFLTPEIAAHAEWRWKKHPRRVFNNLLSSEPMAFNLFGPLRSDLDLATRLLRRLPGFPADATVTDVEFEPRPVKEKHIGDETKFDVFIGYQRADNRKGFIGIETKLTEPFSQKSYEFGDRYAQWEQRGEWWWKKGAERVFSTMKFNQLWRNHLLAFAMLNQAEPEFAEGSCAVVYHQDNDHCADAIDAYRQHLLPRGDETLIAWPLDRVITAWDPVLEPEQRKWLDDFRARYLDLDASESAWLSFIRDDGRRAEEDDDPELDPEEIDDEPEDGLEQ